MKRFDEIINKLFRTKIGALTLALTTCLCAMTMSGCFVFDLLGCLNEIACLGCGGGELLECWSGMGVGCDEALYECTGIYCGSYYNNDCGECYWDCGGGSGNRPDHDDSDCGDCGGCGECGDCGGGSSNSNYKQYTITIKFVNMSTGEESGQETKRVYDTQTSLTFTRTFDSTFFQVEGVYADQGFTDRFLRENSSYLADGKVFDRDMTLYVKYTELYYNSEHELIFEFPEEFNELPVTRTVRVGQTFDVPEPYEHVGYEFTGWTCNGKKVTLEENTKFHLYDFGTTDASITIKATYQTVPLKLKLYYNRNNALEAKNYDLRYNESISHSIADVQSLLNSGSEFKFVGWSYYRNGTVLTGAELAAIRMTEAELSLYAVYKDYVAVMLNHFYKYSENSSSPKMEFVLDGEKFLLPADVTPMGPYRFIGWYSDSSCTMPVSGYVTITKTNKTFYAKWESVSQYTIKYYASPASTSTIYEDSYMPSENTYTLRSHTSDEVGYEFVGWCKNSDLSDTPIMSLPGNSYGDLKLYAKFAPKNYEIYLLAGAGASVSPTSKQVTYGSTFTLPIPTKPDYTFVGWKIAGTATMITDENGTSLAEFTTALVGNLTSDFINVMPEWTEKTYTVTFYSEGGTQVLSTKSDYKKGDTIVLPTSAPDKAGYDFIGWYDSNGQKLTSGATVAGNASYYAKYQVKTFTITLMVDGSQYGSKTVKYGEKISLGVPTKAGKVFLGWYDSDGNAWTSPDGIMRNNYSLLTNVTLTALFV